MTNRTDSPFIFEALPDGGARITGVNDSKITEAVIPKGVKVIGEEAFAFCKELKMVVLPEGLAEIGKFAFSNCHKLTEVTIPSTVTSLDNTAFLGCFDLACIKVESHNEVYRDIDGVLYSSDGFTLISYPVGRKQRSFCIPDTVAVIGSQCFSRNEYLEELTLPDTLMLIEYYALDHLPALTRVNFNGSISDWGRMDIRDGNDKSLGDKLRFSCLDGFEYRRAEDGGYEITGVKDESLTEIVIPEGITGIADSVFNEHEHLTDAVIPASVLSIGDGAFYRCSSLKSIAVHTDNQNYKDIDGNLYTKDGATLIQYAIGKTDTVFTVPEGVREITADAFYDCHAITRIVITEGCLNIGDWAFSWCESLTDITIPNSVKKIGDSAFSSCTSITVFTVPDGVTRIGRRTFEECEVLASIRLPLSITEIGEDAFAYCESLGEVIYEGDREQWAKIAVANGNQSLTKARITYLGEPLSKDGDMEDFDAEKVFSPFEYNKLDDGYEITELKDKNATEVVIPYGVTEIGEDAFEDCKALVSISLPDTVKKIGSEAFSSCSSLKRIRIPESVTSIGEFAFLDCSALESIAIPDGTTSIGKFAFSGCKGLTSVSIGSGVTSIGESAFDGCVSLVSITVSKDNAKYKDIDGNLYSKDGSNLIRYAPGKADTSFAIPDGVIRFGYKPFLGCTNLTSVTIPEGVTTIREYTFFLLGLQSVVIPEGVTSIGSQAFSGCSNLRSVTLPQSLKKIEEWAFNNCEKLSDVKYKGSKKQWKKIDIKTKITYFSSTEKKNVKENTNTNLLKAKIHYEWKD